MTKIELIQNRAFLRQAIKVRVNEKYAMQRGHEYTVLDVFRIMEAWTEFCNEAEAEREEMRKANKRTWKRAMSEAYTEWQRIQRDEKQAWEEFLAWKRTQHEPLDQ